MGTTQSRVLRKDAEGVLRVASAPGDEPATTVNGPTRVEMAPQDYDPETGEFKPDPAPAADKEVSS